MKRILIFKKACQELILDILLQVTISGVHIFENSLVRSVLTHKLFVFR